MKWDYSRPPIGRKVFLDGNFVLKVRAFDTDEGWVRALCLDAHTGHCGQIHRAPNNPSEVCEILLHGVVTLGEAK